MSCQSIFVKSLAIFAQAVFRCLCSIAIILICAAPAPAAESQGANANEPFNSLMSANLRDWLAKRESFIVIFKNEKSRLGKEFGPALMHFLTEKQTTDDVLTVYRFVASANFLASSSFLGDSEPDLELAWEVVSEGIKFADVHSAQQDVRYNWVTLLVKGTVLSQKLGLEKQAAARKGKVLDLIKGEKMLNAGWPRLNATDKQVYDSVVPAAPQESVKRSEKSITKTIAPLDLKPDEPPFGAHMGMTRAELEAALDGKLIPATEALSFYQGAPVADSRFGLYVYTFRKDGGMCAVGALSGPIKSATELKKSFDTKYAELGDHYGAVKFENIADTFSFVELKLGSKKLSASWVISKTARDEHRAYEALESVTLWGISGKTLSTGNLRIVYRYSNGSKTFLAGGTQTCD